MVLNKVLTPFYAGLYANLALVPWIGCVQNVDLHTSVIHNPIIWQAKAVDLCTKESGEEMRTSDDVLELALRVRNL